MILLVTILGFTTKASLGLSTEMKAYCSTHSEFSGYMRKTFFEDNYCHRMFPNSIKESLSENFDVPSSAIDLNIESTIHVAKNKTQWHSKILNPSVQDITLSDEEILAAADWDIILEFNKMAHEIVQTSKSNNFIKDFYSRSLPRNTKKKITSLITQMNSFFKSTSFTMTYGLGAISDFHPLFTELLLEMFYHLHDSSSSLSNMKGGWLKMPNDDTSKAQVTLELVNRFLYTRNDSFSNVVLKDVSEHQLEKTLQFTNIGIMLMFTSSSNCLAWGFKPASHRQLLQFLFSKYANFEGQDLYQRIVMNNKLACGDTALYIDGIGYPQSPYFGKYPEVIKEKVKFFKKNLKKYSP